MSQLNLKLSGSTQVKWENEMTELDIHKIDNYKSIIHAFFEKNNNQKGVQSKMADGCNINRPQFSNVMNSDIHFTLEQGIRISAYMRLTRYEKEYFLALLQRERAGNQELKTYFQDEVEIRRRNITPKYRRVQKYNSPDNINNSPIYSSCWLFEIVETFLRIPKYQNFKVLQKKLNVNESLLKDIFKTLETHDIVQNNNDTWTLRDGWERGKVINDILGVVSHCKQFRDLAMIRTSQSKQGEKFYMSTLNVPLSFKEVDLLIKRSEELLIDTVLLGKSDEQKEDVWVVNLDIFPPGYPD